MTNSTVGHHGVYTCVRRACLNEMSMAPPIRDMLLLFCLTIQLRMVNTPKVVSDLVAKGKGVAAVLFDR